MYSIAASSALSQVVVLSSNTVFPGDGGAYQDVPDFCGIQASDSNSVICSTASLNRMIADLKYLQGSAGSVCAIDASGSLICWGDNSFGGLGTGDNNPVATTNTVSLAAKATDVAMGGGSTCARLENGDVYCWGSRLNFASDAITKEDFGESAVALNVAAGTGTFCAILASGTVRCVGDLGAWVPNTAKNSRFNAFSRSAFGRGQRVSRSVRAHGQR